MFSIAMVIALRIPTLGLIIGAWSIIAWAFVPAGKFLHWLASRQTVAEKNIA